MRSIEVTIRVVVHNPQLQSKKVLKCQASYFVDRLIGVLSLPEVAAGDPPTQILTMAGAVDCYETAEAVKAKIEACCNQIEL